MPHPTPITDAQVARGVSIAQREGDLRWEWADLALEVAPLAEHPGGVGNGRDVASTALREQVAAKGDVPLEELPSMDSLRDYRDAAASVPPPARKGVRVYAALELGRDEPDPVRRLEVLDELRAEHGRVTVNAVRRLYGKATTAPRKVTPTGVDTVLEEMTPERQAQVALEVIKRHPSVIAEAAAADPDGKMPARMGMMASAASQFRSERRDAERRDVDPDRQNAVEDARKRWVERDLTDQVHHHVGQISMRVLFILRAVKGYDGEWHGPISEEVVTALEHSQVRLQEALDTVRTLELVDIDAVIAQLTAEAHDA